VSCSNCLFISSTAVIAIPELFGRYLYADYCSGRFWIAWPDSQGHWQNMLADDTNLLIAAFGERKTGEIYLANYDETVGGLHLLQFTEEN
jgi:hypothetical protein